MKKILVLSDTHGYKKGVDKLLENVDFFDYVYFLGDGYGDIEDYIYAYPNKVEGVLGNCDRYFDGPSVIINKVEDVTFLLTHGHDYHVKYGYETLAHLSNTKGVNCALFGHTHIPTDVLQDGVRLINPGSLGSAYYKGTYSIITVNGSDIDNRLMYIADLLD